MHDLPITIRAVRDSDHGLIFNSWITGLGSNEPFSTCPKDWFSAAQHALIEQLLERSHCTVAVEPDDHDQIYGYLVAEPDRRVLHWIYTKDDFRRAHVASRLMREAFAGFDEPIAATSMTAMLRCNRRRWNLKRQPALLNARSR